MIRTYHAHVYFSVDEMVFAEQVRDNIIEVLPQVTYTGQLIPIAIGPHPKPMFEIHVPAASINYAVATIDSLREGLSVLFHPVQTNELDAHTNGARWLGTKLSLNLDVLN